MHLLIVLFCIFLSGCVNTALSGANVVYKHKYLQDEASDYYITIKSWNLLKRSYPKESLQHVQLTSFHRIVLLTGQVPNQEMRQQLEKSLQEIPHILRIFNATTTEPPTTVKEQVHDSWITTKIKSKMIASNDIYADKIKIVTEKNVVYLMGVVTKEEAETAIALTKETEGVTKVVTIFYYMTMPKIE